MKSVLVLHTGGTLGMAPTPLGSGSAPTSGGRRPTPLQPDTYTHALTQRVPELRELARIETRILCNLDSSDIGPPEWTALCQEIADARAHFDGIVVIHGTDTMAYTASALSFALEGLDRPVILTGSQRPLVEIRTDARRNLVDAVDLATRDIPEVGICFDGQLLRGNRATKGDAWAYHAFTSPSCPPLAQLGLDVAIGAQVRRSTAPFRVDPRFDPHLAVAYLTPAFDARLIERLAGLDPDGKRVPGRTLSGLVLAAFGVGTAPARTQALQPTVAEAVARCVRAGVTVLVATQARAGTVELERYVNSALLADAGAIGAGSMTLEAASVKLMAACGRWPESPDERAAWLRDDCAGEREPAPRDENAAHPAPSGT